MARAVWVTPHLTRALDQGWQCVAVPAGSVGKPSELANIPTDWLEVAVPGTLAAAQRAAGKFQYGQHNFDAADTWFRCLRPLPDPLTSTAGLTLRFDGLATLADVYWDDVLVLSSDNMFLAHEVDLTPLHRDGQLHVHFKSVTSALAQRRPRPRWRTKLVEQQQLRWLRTTLLGRIPGWSPPVAPVGPFRPVSLTSQPQVRVVNADVHTSVVAGDGHVSVQLSFQPSPGVHIQSAELRVAGKCTELTLAKGTAGAWKASGHLFVAQPALWWPHTHGTPALHAAQVVLTVKDDLQNDPADKRIDDAETRELTLDLGPLGFRDISVDQAQGAFAVRVNGVPVFCRGACWTPTDIVSLASDEARLRPTLTLARDAGMNMLRVGGTMVYEDNAFFALCDELGILVWQDFMFANMDYPVSDSAFAASIEAEVRQFLNRTQGHACLAVLCGNSEIEQQAAMLGLTQAHWRNPFFAETLPALCGELRPDVLYWPSSPAGGVLPFQVDHAVSHYYGVGAYLRPLEDARRAGVRFTSECLGFSNIPEEAAVDELLKHGGQAFHHPVWKQRVPRDNGAGWDFEDVRDHYLALLFQQDPMRLRYADMARYLALGRVTTGEVIARTVAEWRRTASPCQGALIWFLRDLWLGAGWGLIDASGQPKAAYWYARRAMKPLTVLLTDEGLNGLEVHLINEGPVPFEGQLSLRLYRHGETPVAQAQVPVQLAAHDQTSLRADALFEHFLDTAYAYKFGPPGHHLAVASLWAASAQVGEPALCEAFFHPLGLPCTVETDLGLSAWFEQRGGQETDRSGSDQGTTEGWQVRISTRKFAQAIRLQVPGFAPEDNYFDVAPGSTRTVALRQLKAVTTLQGSLAPLNLVHPVKIKPSPHVNTGHPDSPGKP